MTYGRGNTTALLQCVDALLATQCFHLPYPRSISFKSVYTNTSSGNFHLSVWRVWVMGYGLKAITEQRGQKQRSLFKQLNLLKVEDILTLGLQELTFYFKYNQGILPKYLQNWNFIPNSKIHNHNTRNITTLHTFKTKHEFAKKQHINITCPIR